MNDFESRLRARMSRLDAAIPTPQPLNIPRRRSLNRRRQGIVLLAATVALLFGVAVVATSGGPVPPTPGEVAADEAAAASNAAYADWVGEQLHPLMPEAECVGKAEAERRIRLGLDRLGLIDWTITADDQARAAGTKCVTFGVDAQMHWVVLVRALDLAERDGGAVAVALEGATKTLITECLNRKDAFALVAAAMQSAGVTDFEIRADPWSPQGGPIDQIDVYRQHVADGCFVFVSRQHENERTILYLWGPWL